MTGSGYQNLCRPTHHRTAGGCCVCSREIEYGGIAEKRAHEKTLVFFTRPLSLMNKGQFFI